MDLKRRKASKQASKQANKQATKLNNFTTKQAIRVAKESKIRKLFYSPHIDGADRPLRPFLSLLFLPFLVLVFVVGKW